MESKVWIEKKGTDIILTQLTGFSEQSSSLISVCSNACMLISIIERHPRTETPVPVIKLTSLFRIIEGFLFIRLKISKIRVFAGDEIVVKPCTSCAILLDVTFFQGLFECCLCHLTTIENGTDQWNQHNETYYFLHGRL